MARFLLQTWFVARVSILPTLMLSFRHRAHGGSYFNILLVEFGAADFSGSATALGHRHPNRPIVTVLVIAGGGATQCAPTWAPAPSVKNWNALRVLASNPISIGGSPSPGRTVVALLLSSFVTIVGLVGGFFFSVFVQNVTPGAFVGGLPLLTGLPEIVIALIKASLFGSPRG